MAGFGPPRKQATSRAVSQSRISSESPPQPRTDSRPPQGRGTASSPGQASTKGSLADLRRAEDDALDAALLLHPLIGGNDAKTVHGCPPAFTDDTGVAHRSGRSKWRLMPSPRSYLTRPQPRWRVSRYSAATRWHKRCRPPGGFRRGQPHLIDEQCECVHKSRLLTIVKLNARQKSLLVKLTYVNCFHTIIPCTQKKSSTF